MSTIEPLSEFATPPLRVEDLKALAVVYREHRSAVFHRARRICGAEAANDVVQDVFVQLWSRPERFDPARGSLRTFLLTLAHHRAVDIVRSENQRRGRERKTFELEGRPAQVALDAHLVEQEQATRIYNALDHLPPRERDVLVAAFYGQNTYREVARLLDQPEGTTKARIRKGMTRLHAELAEYPTEALDAPRAGISER